MLTLPTLLRDKKEFDPQTILDAINKKVAQASDTLLNNKRFGFKNKINYMDINTLLILKGVFVRMVAGSSDYPYCLDDILSKIRNITNKNC